MRQVGSVHANGRGLGWALCAIAIALYGCYDNCDEPYLEDWHTACTTNEECSDVLECFNGYCEMPCMEDRDCPDISSDLVCSSYNGYCFISCNEK